MEHVAGRSNLIYDSGWKTHYLMEVFVKRLPVTAEAIGQFRGIASGMAVKGNVLSMDDYIVLQGYYARLENKLRELQRRYKSVVDVSKEKEVLAAQSVLDLGVGKFVNDTLVFAEDTMESFRVPDKRVDPLEVFSEGTRILSVSTILFDENGLLLNTLLEQRISDLQQITLFSIMLVIFVSVLVWYFVAGFYRANRKAFYSLRVSQERFALAVRGTNDGIWDWDLNTAEVFFSPHWKQMLGYELDDIDDRFIAWRDLVHPDDLGRFLLLWSKYMSGQSESFFVEYRIRKKTGDYAWVLCRGLLSRDEEGNP
jgi:PAS domain S-box-containing protein